MKQDLIDERALKTGCIIIIVLHLILFLLSLIMFYSIEEIGGDIFRPFPTMQEWMDYLELYQMRPEEIRVQENWIRNVSYLLERFFLFFETIGVCYFLLTKELRPRQKIGIPLGILILYFPFFIWIRCYAEFYLLYMKRLPGMVFCLVLMGYLVADRKNVTSGIMKGKKLSGE